MSVFAIHMRGEGLEAARRAIVVRQGFSKSAFVFGPIWLLRHRLWLATLAWCVVAAGLAAATSTVTPTASFVLVLLLSLLTGFEGQAVRGRALARRGYPLVDVVAAADRDEAERRFFERLVNVVPKAAPAVHPTAPVARGGPAVLGLFPEAEGGA